MAFIDALQPYFQSSFASNTGQQYAEALGVFLISTAAFWVFRHLVLKWLQALAQRTSNVYDDLVVDFFQRIRPPLYILISTYLSATLLALPNWAIKAIDYALAIGAMYYLIQGIQAMVSALKNHYVKKLRKTEGDEADVSVLELLESISKAALWVIGILLILSNLGFDVTALIAGLGIGGLAVAIAAQSVLADILASVSIYFDKPFKVGDFIVIGSDAGVVKHIGIKTTRLETLQGQELIVSNKELTESRVNNYKRMLHRRVAFTLAIEHQTPVGKLEKIPNAIKKIINAVPKCRTNRVHFKEFTQTALVFECVYYFDSPDFNAYMDAQQEINLKIAKAFSKNKIRLAQSAKTAAS